LRAALAENQVEMFPCPLYVRDRILRHDTTIIFHFDLQLIVGQHAFAEPEDLRETV